jgi:tetratricopeptide (TPR) repeat protein
MHFLTLSPAEQQADYRARVEKAIHDNPRDAVAQSRYLKILLEENQMAQAATVTQTIAELKPPAVVLTDDGRALLEAKQYGPAKTLLAAAGGADVDLAIATFHAAGGTAAAATEGLRQLDRAPEANRNAPYYLARAQMLNAGGKVEDALAALHRAIELDPSNPELYWQTAMLLTKHNRAPEALRLLDNAAKALPREPAIPLTRAAVLELSGKTGEALKLVDDLQHQSPEVAAVWVAKGMILAAHQHFDEARRALDTAVTHGARSPEANAPGNPAHPLQLFETRPPRVW